MSRKNQLAAIIAIENTPSHEFNMSNWIKFKGRGSDSVGLRTWPCGTVACAAGTIQFNFANSTEDKIIDASEFSADWLGISCLSGYRIFAIESVYGAWDLDNVSKRDVVETMVCLYNLKGSWDEIFNRYGEYSIKSSLTEWARTTNQPLRPKSQQTYVAQHVLKGK